MRSIRTAGGQFRKGGVAVWRRPLLHVVLCLMVAASLGACSSGKSRPEGAATTTSIPAAEPYGGSLAGRLVPPDACPTPAGKYRQADLDRIRPQVEAMADGHASEVGTGATAVELSLRAGQETLAERVYAQFGDAVQIRVGFTNYCGHRGRSAKCPPPSDSMILPAGLSLHLRLDATTVKTSDDVVNGSLTIRQDGPAVFDMDTGQPLIALVVRKGTLDVVGRFDGGLAGTGYDVRLVNGQQKEVPVVVGPAKCDGTIGSALAPGRYGVRAAIGPNEGQVPGYLSPEVPLTITAP